jgi:threonine aldolase
MSRYDFTSDNTAGAAPEALASLVEANVGFASGYGSDSISATAAEAVRALLDVDAEVRFVASGTAANAIACATLCRPFEAMLAHVHAHICNDETGAPGFFGQGLGLVGLPGASGRIDPDALDAALGHPDVAHRQSVSALSLTQSTEYGSVYTIDALERLTTSARKEGLSIHLDGARLANAVAAGFDIKRLKRLGVSLLVIGGTKAGMPLSEAIVLLDSRLARRFDSRLKQAGQLPSKGRFLAAPWIGMLETGAWSARAAHANAMAKALAARMPFPLAHPVEANAVFVEMDEAALGRLQAHEWFVYRFIDGSVRFMCSWATTLAAVEELGEVLRGIA